MTTNQYVTTVVRRVVRETDRVTRFELACPDAWELPPFTAGAHIDVMLSDGRKRQYSLCGDPGDRYRYQIAVLRVSDGRGGSIALHDRVRVGDRLSVSLPRNLFGLASDAACHVFIAGGIGVTPFLSMMAELDRLRQPWELHYCTRTAEDTAFAGMLKASAGMSNVHFYHRGTARLDVAALLGAAHPGHHFYCCGPSSLLDAFEVATRGWPASAVHIERFGSEAMPASLPYKVQLARSGGTVEVAPDQTLAAVLRQAGFDVPTECEAGVCGRCRVSYVAGTPVHRDHILTAAQRRHTLLTCVSAAGTDCLVLDL